ncbi:uncharacterized protein LOC111886499 [Lactuca sativa]|uniref:uncharacterized protein LOC111886499 n=1 Tax=Lactuca sativa TaxID=4236 RepID=UPI000CD9F2CB|nr:uncharacterized protein LOC111886499 [Lactuca sativa]
MLSSLLGSFQPSTSDDGWKCGITADGVFQVAALRYEIDNLDNPVMADRMEWSREVPIKVIGFIWRAIQNRVPTLCALKQRGVDTGSIMYSYCMTVEEESDHVLLSCPFAKIVWEWILSGVAFICPRSRQLER